MTDLDVRSFKNSIVDYVNKSIIPLEVKRLVLSEILSETTKASDDVIRIQIKTYQEENKNSDPEKTPG